ncbi:hypothetical protein MRX96_028414 [Rhipicephalus microplus]
MDEDEIQPAPDITDLDDLMQAAIALNTMAHTMVFDDGACVLPNCVNSDRDATAATTAAESAAGKVVNSAADETESSYELAPLEQPLVQELLLCSAVLDQDGAA